ncbi:putative amino-acid metabolite efflux pump [Rickettsiales bacterium Ac37b]|nr:putative amino-acid metabolite efflux pump [Rickettsiales bacterium Ac37b]
MRYIDIMKALLVAVLWGGSFVAAKLVLEYFPPIFSMVIRSIIVISILLSFVGLPNISLKKVLCMSFSYNIGHMVLLYLGIKLGLPVSAAVIATQMQVPITSILSIIILKEKMHLKQVIGMLISFIGIVIIVGHPSIMDKIFPFMIVIIAAFFFALFNIQIKQVGNLNILSYILWSSILILPQLMILSYISEPISWSSIFIADVKLWLSIAYISMVNIIAFLLWISLLKIYPVSLVMPFALCIPVFAILGSALILSEYISWHLIIGGTITLIGVAIITIKFTNLTRYQST